MSKILNKEEIKNLCNFAFWQDENTMLPCQISLTVHVYREAAFGAGKVGFYYPPNTVMINTELPFLVTKLAKEVDIELTVLVNGLQTIHLKGYPLAQEPPILDDIFKFAINQAEGELKENVRDNIGYVHKKFRNEEKACVYKVTQTGNYFTVSKGTPKNNKITWSEWSNTSPKTKSIIKQFKEEFAKGTLQTSFANQ